jgi:CYTH domain-containing protein
MRRVIKEISAVLALPQPVEEERKYIVELTDALPDDCIESEIIQTYLKAEPGCEVRLRKRGWQDRASDDDSAQGRKYVYVHTSKKLNSDNEEVVTERQINNSLYEMMLGLADPARKSIHKTRRSFIWKGQYFELDTFLEPVSKLMILETKGISESEDVKFPPFIQVLKDITGEKQYYNYNIALQSE